MTISASPSFIADCGGLIDTIAFALPASFFTDDHDRHRISPLLPIGNLLSALPHEMMATIVIDQNCLPSAQGWLEKLPLRCAAELLPLDENSSISHPWIQDMVHVRTDGKGTATELVSAAGNPSARALAKRFGLVTAVSDVLLDGGNQLVGPDFRLVGHSSLKDGSGPGGDTNAVERSQQWQKVEALDGRTVYSFGYRPEDLAVTEATLDLSPTRQAPMAVASRKMHQCGFHVDQFVSVTGLTQDNRPLLLVADPVAHAGCSTRAATDLKRKLDASVLSLIRQGFAVRRNPIPVAPTIDSNKCIPRLYNNVILENVARSGQKQPFVWLPHFGDEEALEEFDEGNRQIWEGLGFHPIGVSGWSHLASRNGALRCATKVISRAS
ncbi:hypothetical protein [Agrobacterium sp. ST15.16.024]|nr:hypothetical protein [Agrobacterium sp. ST15.16.024]